MYKVIIEYVSGRKTEYDYLTRIEAEEQVSSLKEHSNTLIKCIRIVTDHIKGTK